MHARPVGQNVYGPQALGTINTHVKCVFLQKCDARLQVSKPLCALYLWAQDPRSVLHLLSMRKGG